MPEKQKLSVLGRLANFRTLGLEIVAIFIGITASFWVEEWREERADYEILDYALEAIYYDSLRDQAWIRWEISNNNQRIALTRDLVFGDIESLGHEQIAFYIAFAFSQSSFNPNLSGYEGLRSAELGLPFDSTMQRIAYAYDNAYFLYLDALQERLQDGRDLAQRTFSDYGFITNYPVLTFDAPAAVVRQMPILDLPQHAGIKNRLYDGDVFLPDEVNLQQLQSLLDSGRLQQILRQLIQIRLDQNYQFAQVYSAAELIQVAVRERLPNPKLPIQNLGLRGSAIDGVWVRTEHLEREDNGSWWSGEVELEDGMVKFLANESYAISWGVEPDWTKVEPFRDTTHFLGDPATVFPTGTAVFDGQNIPVTAGRYRVRFNEDTFEYAFERVD